MRCIKKIYPDWKGSIHENDYNKIFKDPSENRPYPTMAELEAVAEIVEAEIAAEQELVNSAIVENLPSWATIEASINNISNIAGVKAFLLKQSRLIYRYIKKTAT